MIVNVFVCLCCVSCVCVCCCVCWPCFVVGIVVCSFVCVNLWFVLVLWFGVVHGAWVFLFAVCWLLFVSVVVMCIACVVVVRLVVHYLLLFVCVNVAVSVFVLLLFM